MYKKCSKRNLRRLVKKQRDIYLNRLKECSQIKSCDMLKEKQDSNFASSSNNVSTTNTIGFTDLNASNYLITDITDMDPLEPGCDKFIRMQLQQFSENMEKTFKTQMDMVEKRLDDMNVQIEAQHALIMEALAENTGNIMCLSKMDKSKKNKHSMFPIKSDDELEAVNNEIKYDHEGYFLYILRGYIQKNLAKALPNILSEEMIMAYNVDGTHGKKKLKNFTHFYETLKVAVHSLPQAEGNPEGLLRKAMLTNKRNSYKKAHVERKAGAATPTATQILPKQASFNEQDSVKT